MNYPYEPWQCTRFLARSTGRFEQAAELGAVKHFVEDEDAVIEAPLFVVGYHGCSRETAARLVNGQPFSLSERSWDWLGAGVYFWEYGPYRARDWAIRRHQDPAVIEARITLGQCLNLLDSRNLEEFSRAYHLAVTQAEALERDLPRNDLAKKLHRLDRFMVDFYCRLMEQEGAASIQTVRGCFPEGNPIYPGSAILGQTHVQIAVRALVALPNCAGYLSVIFRR